MDSNTDVMTAFCAACVCHGITSVVVSSVPKEQAQSDGRRSVQMIGRRIDSEDREIG